MARAAKKDVALTPEEKLAQALVPEEEQPYPVPENWCWTTTSNLAEVISKGTTPQGGKAGYVDNGVNFLRVENICDDGTISHEGIMHISEEMHTSFLKRSVLQEGDILVSIAGTLGKTAIVRSHDIPINTNQAVSFIRLKNDLVNGNFIKLAFDSPVLHEHLLSQAKVTSIPNLTLEIIGNCPLPFPPLAEQQRIVDRIESLLAKLDEAKEKAQATVDGFEDRKAAILHKAFTGDLTAEWRKKNGHTFSEWSIRKVSDVGEVITGSTPSTNHTEYYNGPIPFIKPTELNQGRTVNSSVETLTEQGKEVSRPIRAGSTCICCIGATISKCGLVSMECVTNQQINSIVPHDFMDDVFVYYYCCSNRFKNELIDNSSATTLPIINKKKTSALSFVVPPKKEQQQIAKILDSILEKELQAKETAEQVIDQIDTMKKAILARAFRGELGTNDPTDESAEELLKQVL